MEITNEKIERKREKNINAIILLIYIYMPFITNILESVFSVSSVVSYILQIILILIWVYFYKINKNVCVFLCIFATAIGINYILVEYKYYVLVEGIQAFLGIAIPCLVISDSQFDLESFLKKWYKFSQKNILLVVLSIILFKKRMVNYSIFTSICIPNIFIISTMILLGKEKILKSIIIALINVLSIVIFGGRMASAVSLCMMIISFIYSSNIASKKKILVYFLTIIATIVVLNHFEDILLWINRQLNNRGLYSRNIALFIEQMKKNELYYTGRDEIYIKCFEYIQNRIGLPGGFGVPLYLTNGKYYYSHNLILQLLITFGIFGTILVISLLCFKLYAIKKYKSKNYFKLVIFMFFSYLLIGMTGSSIWIHYISTMFIALVFFKNNKPNKNEEKRKNEKSS